MSHHSFLIKRNNQFYLYVLPYLDVYQFFSVPLNFFLFFFIDAVPLNFMVSWLMTEKIADHTTGVIAEEFYYCYKVWLKWLYFLRHACTHTHINVTLSLTILLHIYYFLKYISFVFLFWVKLIKKTGKCFRGT